MERGTINDITKLKFFKDDGLQIPMQIEYVLSWELVPGQVASNYFQEIPSGYFIGDADLSDPSDIKIIPDSFTACFSDKGKIIMQFSTVDGTDEHGIHVYRYDDNITPQQYLDYAQHIFLMSGNKVKISINAKGNQYSILYNVRDVFTFDQTTYPEQYYEVNTIYTGTNNFESYEYFQTIGLCKVDLTHMLDGSGLPFVYVALTQNTPNIGIFFPFMIYKGSYHQEKVSEKFISTDTLMILEEHIEDGVKSYERPFINSDSPYYLSFQPESGSELKILKKDLEYEIEYRSEAQFDLASPIVTSAVEPLYFSIAFQSDEEGSYQNYLGIYMKSKDNPDIVFFMGLISVKTEVEGEDERFRTLLGNNGIPDPKYYSNLFAEQEYDEECSDYMLVNKKSKELMLSFEQIFSYVGTYKALINAIRFLGYYDIIFKEWYTLKTTNDSNVDIAVQVFDTSSGQMLKQKLADYGVSIEDFRNYNKINKLTMVYHLNQQSEKEELLQRQLVHYDKESQKIVKDSQQTFISVSEVPLTEPLYIYRNDEIIAKLYAVKKWLERNVIGVGAYIADITGEGIYFGWQKTQGYHTLHHLADYSQQQYYTADVKEVGKFIDSSTYVRCTLNELNNAVRFEDYNDTPIQAFIRNEKHINMQDIDGVLCDVSTLFISNSIEAPVLGDEYEFDLVLHSKEGTLYEWTEGDQQIYFNGNEIKLLFEKFGESATINFKNIPYITLENANIHKVYGKWESNVKWLVREYIDASTGNTKYRMKNYELSIKDSYEIHNDSYFILYKASNDAYIKYTSSTKWNMPMFVIHGLKLKNVNVMSGYEEYFDLSEGEYILEILKGDMLFRDVDGCSCKVMFSDDNLISQYDNREQSVDLEYVYHSDRKPFVLINDVSILIDTSVRYDFSTYIDPIIYDNMSQISQTYDTLLDNIESLIETNNTAAYEEAKDFIENEMVDDITEFLNYKNERMVKQLLYEEYMKAYEKHYICNDTIDTSVTRLGKYDVLSRSYDSHNNVFVSKYVKQAVVQAKPMRIDTLSFNSSSGNSDDFYRYNIEGQLVSDASLQDIKNNSDDCPKFPFEYKVVNADVEDSSVSFVNMSYAIDTPKNNDYIIFENCTELAVKCSEQSKDTIQLNMIDENPNKNNIYNADTVNVVIYNIASMSDIDVIHCKVKSYKKVSGEEDANFKSDSYLILDILDGHIAEDVCELINDINNKTYVLNTTEHRLTNFYPPFFIGKQTYLEKSSDSKRPIFNVGDSVKIRQYIDCSVDGNDGQLVNEVAYNIQNIYANRADGTYVDLSLANAGSLDYSEFKTYTYVLDGLLPIAPINSLYLTYSTHYPVHYVTQINGDGREYLYNMGYDNYYILKDEFKLNNKFFKKYIDDTFSCYIMPYDPGYLKKDWSDLSKVLNTSNGNVDIYMYDGFPVTINEEEQIAFLHNDDAHAFRKGYHVQWNVRNTVIDDTANYDNYMANAHKELMYRSANDILSFKATTLGSYDIQLESIDVYGSKLVNEGSGLLYVKQTKMR